MKQTHLSLFTGIGGIDLAAEWANFETVGQCEWADYPTKVLEKHWPNVPRWRDIRTLTKESFYEKTGRTTVELISGGFPCQPFSSAGQRRGEADDRFLWPEMLRVISELQPNWIIGENVAGIISMGIERPILDLGSAGFETQAFLIPACSVNAPHRRERVFIIAHRNSERGQSFSEWEYKDNGDMGNDKKDWPLLNWNNIRVEAETRFYRESNALPSRICRVDDGIPDRMDRLKCLGNAVVPQQVYPILKAIYDINLNASATFR